VLAVGKRIGIIGSVTKRNTHKQMNTLNKMDNDVPCLSVGLRDYFAGQALLALIPQSGMVVAKKGGSSFATYEDRTVIAYEIADLMLSARSFTTAK
jgi:hypothetical protein